jgi:hypothetical protein
MSYSYPDNKKTFEAKSPTTVENIQGLYLTTDALANGNTYQTIHDNGYLQAKPIFFLKVIQFDKQHYSTISYQPENLHHRYLNGKQLNEIDIGVTNHDEKLYEWSETWRFHLVLVLEIVQNDVVSDQFIKLYNTEGYEKAHTADKLILRKR